MRYGLFWLELWDITTVKVIRHLVTRGGPGFALVPIELSLGLTGGDDASVILWDIRDGREVRRHEGHTLGVSSVASRRTPTKS